MEKGVEGSNVAVSVSLEFFLERSSGNTSESSSEVRRSSTDIGSREGSEDGSSFGRNLSSGEDVVQFNVHGLFSVNGNGDGDAGSDAVVGWGEGEFTFFGDELSCKTNSFSRSVFGKDFWNNESHVISGNCDVQFGKEIGDIKFVSSGEGRLKKSVEGILGKVSLSSLTGWVSDWEGNWGIFGWSSNILVEEISEDGNFGNVVGGDDGTWSIKSVVSGDSSKIWDSFLISIDDEVLVDGGINDSDDLSLNLFDNEWDNGGFEKWDEDGSDLGNEGSGKSDIEIIWVDGDIRFLNLKFWSHLGGWCSSLLRNINFHIDSHLFDVNFSRSSDGDPVGVGEISSQNSSDLVSFELSSVVSVIGVEGDSTNWWLWKSNSDVLEVTSIEINFWDLDVLDDVEDVWNSNILSIIDTFSRDGYTDTWSVWNSSGGGDESDEFVEHI